MLVFIQNYISQSLNRMWLILIHKSQTYLEEKQPFKTILCGVVIRFCSTVQSYIFRDTAKANVQFLSSVQKQEALLRMRKERLWVIDSRSRLDTCSDAGAVLLQPCVTGALRYVAQSHSGLCPGSANLMLLPSSSYTERGVGARCVRCHPPAEALPKAGSPWGQHSAQPSDWSRLPGKRSGSRGDTGACLPIDKGFLPSPLTPARGLEP